MATFEADTKCINCDAELQMLVDETMSVSDFSLEPVWQQRTFYVDKDGSMFCPPDDEGIIGEHWPEGDG